MTVTRLLPASSPDPDVSDNDRIVAALTAAIEDQKNEEFLKDARGVVVVWLLEKPGEAYASHFVTSGMSALEAIGLMHITAEDMGRDGAVAHDPLEVGPA